MCCLYGFLHYGDNKINDLKEITNSLSKEAAQRGRKMAFLLFLMSNDKMPVNGFVKLFANNLY